MNIYFLALLRFDFTVLNSCVHRFASEALNTLFDLFDRDNSPQGFHLLWFATLRSQSSQLCKSSSFTASVEIITICRTTFDVQRNIA